MMSSNESRNLCSIANTSTCTNIYNLDINFGPKYLPSGNFYSKNENTKDNKQTDSNDDWPKILAAYRKKFGQEQVDNQGRPCLSFPTFEDSTKFYSEQAQQGNKFMIMERGADGTGLSGNYEFSIGDGNVYKGHVDASKIREIENAMNAWENTIDLDKKKEYEQIFLQGVSSSQLDQYRQKNEMLAQNDDEDEDEERANRRSLRL